MEKDPLTFRASLGKFVSIYFILNGSFATEDDHIEFDLEGFRNGMAGAEQKW
jgi:hypothetical protein